MSLSEYRTWLFSSHDPVCTFSSSDTDDNAGYALKVLFDWGWFWHSIYCGGTNQRTGKFAFCYRLARYFTLVSSPRVHHAVCRKSRHETWMIVGSMRIIHDKELHPGDSSEYAIFHRQRIAVARSEFMSFLFLVVPQPQSKINSIPHIVVSRRGRSLFFEIVIFWHCSRK